MWVMLSGADLIEAVEEPFQRRVPLSGTAGVVEGLDFLSDLEVSDGPVSDSLWRVVSKRGCPISWRPRRRRRPGAG